MGAIRITQGLLVTRTLSNLNSQLRRIAVLQEQLSTGFRVNRPSDDPIDARRAINIRTLIGQSEQFLSNITDASPVLNETVSQLQQAVEIIHRANELTLRGANGTNAAQLDVIALEVNQLLESFVVTSNHQTNGRFIFGGTRTLAEPFTVTRVGGDITAVTYNGNAERIQVAISEGALVPMNEPGSLAFQNTVDIFQTLIDIRDNLLAGNQADLQNVRLDELDQALDQLLISEARVGAIQNRLDRVTVNTETFIVQLRTLLSEKIEADFADTIVNLTSQQNAFEAALNAAGRVFQPSLLDFVR